MQGYRKLTTICAAAVLAFGLAACGGSSDDDQTMMQCPTGQIGTYPDCSDPPTPYDTAKAAIAAATTAEAAQKAYEDVKGDVTAAQGEMLQAAVDARIMAINMAARVDGQKMALSEAAGMIDTSDLSTQALVDAANEAIRGLRQALEDADDVSDADKAMYMSQLNDAVDAVDEAQGGIDTATRRMNQMTALSGASDTLQAALAALSGSTPTQAQLDAANNALTALNAAITGGADLTDDEKAPYQREANNAAAPIQTAQTAFDNAEDEAQKTANAAMAVTAMRLYTGIGAAPFTDRTVTSDGGDGVITVASGVDGITPAAQPLSVDKDATVADHYGWKGAMHTAEPDGANGTYEAVVYSNVGEPTEGEKFNVEYTANFADGVLAATIVENTANSGRVASPRFDQSSGIKRFPLPDPNPSNATTVTIPGSFHGVAGTYSCTPGGTSVCATRLAANGFELGTVPSATDATWTAANGQWTFKPTNPETRLMDSPDKIYASYGWWIHKSEDGETFTASAFVTTRGTVPAAGGIDTLQGTATYMGGAAGKYSLRGSTGGTNDAGHFTARATLEADFGDNMITGTIDNFIGADGQSRNWSVELMEQGVNATGTILGDGGNGTAGTDEKMTKWTIDGTAGTAAGQWSGTLYNNGADGVPQVGTGTFHSTYGQGGNDGRMVGAFGVNKQ